MAYCTAEEVRKMIKTEALDGLLGDDFIEDSKAREKQFRQVTTAAIRDACGEIDGYIGSRYRVPVSPAPEMIGKCARDIAVYNLFSREGIDERGITNNYYKRYAAAIKYLTLVAEGKIDLDTGTGSGDIATGFSVSSSPRLFTRRSMRGM